MKNRILITTTDVSLYISSLFLLLTLITNEFFLVLMVFGPIFAVLVRDYIRARNKFEQCL